MLIEVQADVDLRELCNPLVPSTVANMAVQILAVPIVLRPDQTQQWCEKTVQMAVIGRS